MKSRNINFMWIKWVDVKYDSDRNEMSTNSVRRTLIKVIATSLSQAGRRESPFDVRGTLTMKAGRIMGNRKSTATSSPVPVVESTLVAVAAMPEGFGHVCIYPCHSTTGLEEFPFGTVKAATRESRSCTCRDTCVTCRYAQWMVDATSVHLSEFAFWRT